MSFTSYDVIIAGREYREADDVHGHNHGNSVAEATKPVSGSRKPSNYAVLCPKSEWNVRRPVKQALSLHARWGQRAV